MYLDQKTTERGNFVQFTRSGERVVLPSGRAAVVEHYAERAFVATTGNLVAYGKTKAEAIEGLDKTILNVINIARENY